jgi:predicted amidohydrolase YtcJ
MKLIIHNANILTSDPLNHCANAIALDHANILAVGNNEDILELADHSSRVIDLRGYTVLPGLTDSHIHLRQYSVGLSMANFDGDSKQLCIEKVKQQARRLQPGEWILGHGWDHNSWGGTLPTANDLDRVALQNPVYLTGKSLHIAWVNSLSLNLAKVSSSTNNPIGGIIQKDASGNPTGILFDNAILLIEAAIPTPSLSETKRNIQRGIQSLHRLGITAIHDFDDFLTYQALVALHEDQALNLHVYKNIPIKYIHDMMGVMWKTGKGDAWLRMGCLKLFADGALGSQTASMLEPYEGSRGTFGLTVTDENTIIDYGTTAISKGIALAIHAIGDRANHEVIRALRKIRSIEKERNMLPLNHRIEHVQLIADKDLPFLKTINITASMQPMHAISDAVMAENLWGNRSKNAYAWKSILRSGADLIFGSDAPVESPNPFQGIHAAITRSTKGLPDFHWHQNQCINLNQAIFAYTNTPAKSSGNDMCFGMLRKSLSADLVVIKENPMLTPSELIYNIKPVATMLSGKWMWQSKDFTF